jgi:hypothetical protein
MSDLEFQDTPADPRKYLPGLNVTKRADGTPRMTDAQRDRLWQLCGSYSVAFREDDYTSAFDLPQGWVNGWVGGNRHGYGGDGKLTIFVGVSPEGEAHS